jgi:hypothetical protein
MMKPTGLLAACGVLAVLSGVVLWFQKHPAKPESTLAASPKILALGEDQVEGIRLVKAGSDPIVLKKTGDRWMLTEPKQADADQDAMRSLVSSLATLNSDRLIDEKPSDLTAFGLSSPAEEVDVTLKGGAVNKLLIGSDTPAGNGVYAKLEADPKVYTIAASTKSNFERSVNDLRDKRLLTFNSDKVTAVSFTSKGPAVEFAKNGQNEWQITKPGPYRADSPQVDDLLRKLKDARMDLATDDQKKTAAEYAAASKVGVASVTDNSGTQTVEIHEGKDKTFYAKSSAVPGIYKMTGDLGEGLKDKDADSFRNKKLFDFNFSDPGKVEINGAAYSKSGDKWTGPAGQIDPASIQSVIDKLRDLSAARFSAKMGGTQTLEFAVTSGDNHKVEKVTINKNGEEYDAQRGGEPAVYVLDAGAFNDLQKAVSGIKPYQAPKPDKKK